MEGTKECKEKNKKVEKELNDLKNVNIQQENRMEELEKKTAETEQNTRRWTFRLNGLNK